MYECEMRYHTFKTSHNRSLLIGDSQVKRIIYPEVNILSLPGAKVEDVHRFLPAPGRYEVIALLIGGNNLYNGYLPSNSTIQEVVDEIVDLANTLFEFAEKIYVFGIPPRWPPESELEQFKAKYQDHELFRHFTVNKRLSEESEKYLWSFRGISEAVWSRTQLSDNDSVHINDKGKGKIVSLIKNKVLYTKKTASDNHPKEFECTRYTGCRCDSFSG